MDKRRLTILIDVMIALAMLTVVKDHLYIPGERSLRGFWEIHKIVFRVGASVLWLAALWAGMYRPWDRARRVSASGVLLGAALAVCVLGCTYFTSLIVYSNKARFSQEVYGGWMLLTLGVNYCLHLSLEKANGDVPECIAASRRWRRTLAVALGLLVAGMAVCATCYPQAMWYSVALASAVMLVMTGLNRDLHVEQGT